MKALHSFQLKQSCPRFNSLVACLSQPNRSVWLGQDTRAGKAGRSNVRVDDFDFELPDELIALRPAVPRDAARLLVLRSAWFNSNRQANMRWASMAKVFATDMAMKVTTDCVQIMGSYGYSKEGGVEKYMRDAKITQISIGANEFTRQVIGESL